MKFSLYRFMVPLLLSSLACICMGVYGQTFQYSRGWTNGKRASSLASLGGNHHRGGANDDDVILPEIYEIQDGGIDRKLEKCLLQLQRFVRNPLLPRVSNTSPNYSSTSNNNNNLFGNNRHQSIDLFEELNAAAAAAASVEPSDYGKH